MSDESLGARSMRAVLWSGAGAIGKVAGQLIVQIVLARLLTPQAFGEFAALIVVLSLSYLLSDSGFGSALIHKKEVTRDDIGLVLGWSLLLAALVAMILWLIAPLLAAWYGDAALTAIFRVGGLLVLIQPLVNLPLNLMRRDLEFKAIQLLQMCAYLLVYGGVAVSLALLGYGAWSLVLAYAAQCIFVLVVACVLRPVIVRPRLRGDRALVSFGLKSMLTDFSTWCTESFDQFVVGRLWGLQALGAYAVSMGLCRAPTGILNYALQNIVFSSASRLQDKSDALRHGYLAALAGMALIVLPLFSLLSFQAAAVIDLLYGPKWVIAVPVVNALALAMPAIALGMMTAAILRGMGEVGIEMRLQVGISLALFAALFALAKQPLALAAWAIPTIYWVRFTLLLGAVCRRMKLSGRQLLASLRGGAVLACVGIVASSAATFWPAIEATGPAHISLWPLLAGVVAVLATTLTFSAWLLGGALASMLRNRFASGRLGPLVVRLAGVSQ